MLRRLLAVLAIGSVASVDINHVAALKNAWISGGQKLPQPQRQTLANEPLKLMASSASANRQKGARTRPSGCRKINPSGANMWPPRSA